MPAVQQHGVADAASRLTALAWPPSCGPGAQSAAPRGAEPPPAPAHEARPAMRESEISTGEGARMKGATAGGRGRGGGHLQSVRQERSWAGEQPRACGNRDGRGLASARSVAEGNSRGGARHGVGAGTSQARDFPTGTSSSRPRAVRLRQTPAISAYPGGRGCGGGALAWPPLNDSTAGKISASHGVSEHRCPPRVGSPLIHTGKANDGCLGALRRHAHSIDATAMLSQAVLAEKDPDPRVSEIKERNIKKCLDN